MIARLPRPHTKESDCIDANTPDGRTLQSASGRRGRTNTPIRPAGLKPFPS